MGKLQLSWMQRAGLKRTLKQTHEARLYRRTLAVLEYDRGKSIAEIARTLHVSRRSIERWLERYGQFLDPECLEDEERIGRPRRWSEECSQWLQACLDHTPAELGYYGTHWNVPLLRDPLWLGAGQRFSDDTIRRALRALGYVWKRTRYALEPDDEREKKTTNSPGNSPLAAPQCRAG